MSITAPTADELRAYLDRLGIGITDFARLVPCDYRSVQKWLRGERAMAPMYRRIMRDVERELKGTRK